MLGGKKNKCHNFNKQLNIVCFIKEKGDEMFAIWKTFFFRNLPFFLF